MKREMEPYQLIERSIIKKYRKELWTPFIVAVKRYELIKAGDKIAVCISGGKDSMLMAKLIELKELEHKDKIEDLQGEYSQISWGSQIRSYVFQPYTMVKDHRTNTEIGNVQSVMDGNIMPFINAYLKENQVKPS